MQGNRESRWLLLVYGCTVFVSAFLLFQVQPLISKCILPWFGGSPSVWTTCMLFFQAMLFLGYAYAHVVHRTLSPRWQVVVHFALLMSALAVARIEPSAAWKPRDASTPTWHILVLLAASVGLPYFALATTGPLLQAWYSRAFAGRNPYRLYALSNLGSLIALVSYPLWFEPRFAVSRQASIWFYVFAVFVALSVILGIRMRRIPGAQLAEEHISKQVLQPQEISRSAFAGERRSTPTWTVRALWLLLPACGSFMLLATTNHVCQDVAVVPMLWIVPLVLYLLSFIVAFDHSRWYRPWAISLAAITVLYGAAAIQSFGLGRANLYKIGFLGPYLAQCAGDLAWLGIADNRRVSAGPELHIGFMTSLLVYFAAMFLVCLVCHGQLARLRPAPRYLTSYYLAIAAGGTLGGLFVSLIAPLLFTTYFEWKLAAMAAYLAGIALVFYYWPKRCAQDSRSAPAPVSRTRSFLTTAPKWIATGVLLLGLADVLGFLQDNGVPKLVAERDFFGTVSIAKWGPLGRPTSGHALLSGRIVHGFQFSDPKRRMEPTSYYGRDTGIGRTLQWLGQRKSKLRVATIGLGIGSVAAYARPGSHFTFYEFNPAVERLARHSGYFSYLGQHADRTEVVLGDARLSLERQSPQRYDLIVLDAFTGDAIPTHLLTREAFAIYGRQLAHNAAQGIEGSIVVNVTNKYLDLRPVVVSGANQLGLQCVTIQTRGDDEQMTFPARWMVLTRDRGLLDALSGYQSESPTHPPICWTDDYTVLVQLMIR